MDLEQLLQTTLELEGAIRVVLNNDSPEARALLESKLAALQAPRETPPAPAQPAVPAEPQAAPNLKGAFTVNDRFYFIRKLFNGDGDEFDQTVQLLSEMPDMKEVEDFLYVDMMWDAGDPVVEEFVTRISRHIPE